MGSSRCFRNHGTNVKMQNAEFVGTGDVSQVTIQAVVALRSWMEATSIRAQVHNGVWLKRLGSGSLEKWPLADVSVDS